MARKASSKPESSNSTPTIGFVLADGSMSPNQSGKGDIRRALIEADLTCLAMAA